MRWPWSGRAKTPEPEKAVPVNRMPSALCHAAEQVRPVRYPIQPPVIAPGVVPPGEPIAVQMAFDASPYQQMAGSMYTDVGDFGGFPGYPYLSTLSLRTEYRALAETLAVELTRKGIKLQSTGTSGDETKDRITKLEKALDDFGVMEVLRLAFEHDAYFGIGMIMIVTKSGDLDLPLIPSPKTIKVGDLKRFTVVEPIWITPTTFNALDPAAPDFYKPPSWWILGQNIHASRLIPITTRPVPDMFKPAFNFGGISLSQLMEPYVNNWLRTRQSVSDLINNFSIVILKTAMDQVLSGGSDGANLFSRIQLFTSMRSNKGVMVLDKDREEMDQIAVPLGGLHELQAQALELLCVGSHEPAVKLTGISPSGFGNTSEGEMRSWADRVEGLQVSDMRQPLKRMLDIVQLSLFGEIDPDITFDFVPLYQMTEEQMSNIRNNDSIRAGNYIDRGVIDAQEERERLARDPKSGYQGIDIEREIEMPTPEEMQAPLARGTA